MDRVGKRKIHIVSVTIQWCEEDATSEVKQDTVTHAPTAESQRSQKRSRVYDEKLRDPLDASARPHGKRLLSSDRVVLNALRQRVPRGKQVTTPVRTRELEVECELSRRQVQICIKRLSEKRFIKRLSNNADLGNTEGCRFHLSKDVLRG